MQEVSQKPESIDAVFNPAQFSVSYPQDPKERDLLDQERKDEENKIYQETVDGLESDLRNLGMEVTHASKMIIGQIAMNMVLLGRAKMQILCRSLLSESNILKKSGISYTKVPYSGNHYSKSISYDYFPENREKIHPMFDKMMPKLQKQINEGLKALALLPCQQIERQKLTIVKKLKERYTALNGSEVTVEAKAETTKTLSNLEGQIATKKLG